MATLAAAAMLLISCAAPTSVARADEGESVVARANRDGLSFQQVSLGTSVARLSASGSGCLPNTWQVTEPGSGFAIVFDDFVARIGAGSTDKVPTRFCNLRVALTSPTPRRFALTKYRYKGVAGIGAGITAQHASEYWFVGTEPAALDNTSERTLTGPYDKPFDFRDDLSSGDSRRLVWSSCVTSATLMIETRITLSPPDATTNGYISLTSMEGFESALELDVTSEPCTPVAR